MVLGGSGSHLWSTRYTLDREFLREKAFPLIRGAVEFYLGYLVPYDGYLVTAPSTSPENTFTASDHSVHSVTFGSTMDCSILKELFGNYLKACEILDITDLTDEVKAALKKLLRLRSGKKDSFRSGTWTILRWICTTDMFHSYTAFIQEI